MRYSHSDNDVYTLRPETIIISLDMNSSVLLSFKHYM